MALQKVVGPFDYLTFYLYASTRLEEVTKLPKSLS